MVETITSSDGNPIAAGEVSAIAVNPAIVSITVDPITNKVTLGGITAGTSNVNYSAPGYNPVALLVTVLANPLPSLIVTDGPEI